MSVTAGVPPSITTPDTVQSRLGTLEHNWIQTVPGKGWLGILRLYSPLQPFFDKSWRPSEIEAYSTGSNGHDPQTRR